MHSVVARFGKYIYEKYVLIDDIYSEGCLEGGSCGHNFARNKSLEGSIFFMATLCPVLSAPAALENT
jgi:hypothetical protein